jgi:hypothetical protein
MEVFLQSKRSLWGAYHCQNMVFRLSRFQQFPPVSAKFCREQKFELGVPINLVVEWQSGHPEKNIRIVAIREWDARNASVPGLKAVLPGYLPTIPAIIEQSGSFWHAQCNSAEGEVFWFSPTVPFWTCGETPAFTGWLLCHWHTFCRPVWPPDLLLILAVWIHVLPPCEFEYCVRLTVAVGSSSHCV